MADGAWEITHAIREVYGEELTDRIMCWSHKDAAYKPKLKALKKASPILATKLEHDIHEIQWMVSSKQNFKDVYELLERKFTLGKHTAEEKALLETFFAYHKRQWGPDSHVANWIEAANPFSIGSNQGVESKNGVIKKEYTYRERLSTAEFFEQAEKICHDDSKKDDCTLEGPRVLYLLPDIYGNVQKDSFRLQEAGYQYFVENLKRLPSGQRKPGCVVEVNPENKYKLCEVQQIGKVNKIIVLKSSANTLLDCTLEELAKLRILARGCSSAESLDDYMELRKSCHIVEQCGREFYCDCYWGIKGKLCKHTMALVYDRDSEFPVDARLRAKKLHKRKRGVGRPAKVKEALRKTPPKNMVDQVDYVETGREVMEVPRIDFPLNDQNDGSIDEIEIEDVDNDHNEGVEDAGNVDHADVHQDVDEIPLIDNDNIETVEDEINIWCKVCEDDEFEQVKATHFCDICDDNFCDLCTGDHKRFRATKSHQVEKVKS